MLDSTERRGATELWALTSRPHRLLVSVVEEYGAADRRVTQVVVAKKQAARICRGRVGVGAGHCLLFCSRSVIDKDVTDDGNRTSSCLAAPLFVLPAFGPGGRCF